MRLTEFEERAERMWEEIPARFREGIDALVVEPEAAPHPDLRGVYTLGECVTDRWPDAYGGEGEVRSRIVLYHGSFRALAAASGDFDWDDELWETLLHELLHHREYAAAEEGLELYDEAVEQNFRRHVGRPFDPAFYRAVPAAEDGSVRIESDIFVETAAEPKAGRASFAWRGRRFGIDVPPSEAVQYVRVVNLAGGRLWLIVWRRRPWWRRLVAGGPAAVEELERRALPVPGQDGTTGER